MARRRPAQRAARPGRLRPRPLAAAPAAAEASTRTVAPQLDPPQTVRFSYTQIAAETPVYLAIEHGYFKELGINAELIPMTNATETMPMLTADQLDFGSQAVSPAFFNAVARGVGIRMVGDRGSNIGGKSTVSLAIRKDIVDGLPWTGFQNLKGLKIAVSGRGSSCTISSASCSLAGWVGTTSTWRARSPSPTWPPA